MKSTCYWVALIAICLCREVVSRKKKGYYTIIAPSTIHPDSDYHISFTLNEFHKSCWFNVSLTGFDDKNGQHNYTSVEVQPGTTKLVKFHVQPSVKSVATLEILGYNGIISKDTATVFIDPDPFWTFVRTNKAQYKPGDLVKFRVVSIDRLTRPTTRKIDVDIRDADFNLLKRFNDVIFVKGVFKGTFQLSEHPVLGEWGVVATVDELINSRQSFMVERYVLPKFNVRIYTKIVSVFDEKLELNISAHYFYDKPVKGNLTFILRRKFDKNSLTKQLQINGMVKLIFDLKKDLGLRNELEGPNVNSTILSTISILQIEAIVIDSLTEEQSWATKEIEILNQPYKIHLEAPNIFEPDPFIQIKVKVQLTDLQDNPIVNLKKQIQIIVLCEESYYKRGEEIRIQYEKEVENDFTMISIKNENYNYCFVSAEYETIRSDITVLNKKPKTMIDIQILTESPQEGKSIEVEITGQQSFEEFTYEILSKEDIIQAGHVKVPGNVTTYIWLLNMTSEMVPKITIYVHLIQNKKFAGKLKDVLVKKAVRNSIELKTDEVTNPGNSVYVNVTTNEGSYVGLMGLDRSALENIKKENIFDEDKVNLYLERVNSLRIYPNPPNYGVSPGGVITFSNVFPKEPQPGQGAGGFGGGIPIKPLRKLFPESWLYEDFETVPEGGLHILRTVPDSITTWAITGFSIHPDNGLAFTKNITDLRVFQEFFVSFDLPGLVKVGEIIEIPIIISNYMIQDTLVNVTLETDNENLKVHDNPEASSKEFNGKLTKHIPAKNQEKLTIFLRSDRPGKFNLTVKAESLTANDTIQKTLHVQQHGVQYTMSKIHLVHLAEEGVQENEIAIDIPGYAVPGSQKIDVSVVGDIFQPLMRKLQKLVRVPVGNGEENMRFIMTNCLVLKYLKTLNYSNPTLEKKIELNLDLGYQNQLSFKFLDGSFGLFDTKIKRTGDIWQTAFALWGLSEASSFIPIEDEVIKRGFRYLESKQQDNGCFGSGKGTQEDLKLTAFGVIVFFFNKYSREVHNKVIAKGSEYLKNVLDDLEYSPYSTISNYALLLSSNGTSNKYFKNFAESGLNKKHQQLQWGSRSDTLQFHLEVIAASLIRLFESQNKISKTELYVVKAFLASKGKEEEEEKDQSSTSHIIALQTIMIFLKTLLSNNRNLDISFKDDQNKSEDFQINADNSQILQFFEPSQNATKISLQSKGQGFAVVSVNYKYNLVPENQTSSLISINIESNRTSLYLGFLKIILSSLTENIPDKLFIMEVNLQSGYVFPENDLEEDENLPSRFKSIQVNDNRDKAIVHFKLTAEKKTYIELRIRKSYNVLNSEPGWILVHDALDEGERTTKSFRIDGKI